MTMAVTRGRLLGTAVFLSFLIVGNAQADMCPDFLPTPDGDCVEINNWSDFLSAIESASSELFLCPFDIRKEATDETAVIGKGISIRCRRRSDTDICTIRGPGTHLRVATSENTLFHGLSLRESDDHAVHIVSDTEGASDASHTFCYCSFLENKRQMSTRGGAFQTERAAGTVHIVNSFFGNNYSTTYGAAIYTRTNQLNVIDSYFVDNTAAGWGGAIFSAVDGNIMIQRSNFSRNYGKDGYATVVNPKIGPGVWTDGSGNDSMSDRCDGFYNLLRERCESFIVPTPTTHPTVTAPPTAVPSMRPSPGPSISLVPSVNPDATIAPTGVADTLCSMGTAARAFFCTDVETFEDLKAAIEGSDDVVLCGGFRLRKPDEEILEISDDIEIRCYKLCTVYGRGTHMKITGEDTQVRIHKMKFMNSDESAIQILTSSPQSTTTFCGCQFWNNKAAEGNNGGALFVGDGSGVVNVVDGQFSNNQASTGGAIFSQAYMLNVVDSKFVMNQAFTTASAIFSDKHAHILIRSTLFGLNRISSTLSSSNYDVVVHPETVSQPEISGVYVDAGMNFLMRSGDCQGFYVLSEGICEDFDVVVGQPLLYPYVPGDLSVYNLETGLRLSTGLVAREIARTGENVKFTSSTQTDIAESATPFHAKPNGAATFPLDDGGWTYISGSELPNGKGGAYAVVFDSDGEVRDYQPRLTGTSRNSNGGATPFGTWISCEIKGDGQCWQVDPRGGREPELTFLGGPEGGYLESFAYDVRDASDPTFFVSELSANGVLRSVKPGNTHGGWNMLTKAAGVVREYLVMHPTSMTFSWSTDIEVARVSAAAHYPNSEGLSASDGTLYITSKDLGTIFALDLDSLTYTASNTSEAVPVGGGGVLQEGDQLLQITDKILYIAENGGSNPGVYGRDLSTGEYFAVFEAFAEEYDDDDVTGISFSPDWKRMYACFEDAGIMFEIQREDGLPFEEI